MNVDGDIIDHPKYLELKEVIKRDALEYLVLIWKHCSRNQKGEFWDGASPSYLEKAARWHGEPKKLYKTLIAIGWIIQEETGIRIHDWEQMNSHTVKAWGNGALGGRPKRLKDKDPNNPSVSPAETHGLSPEKPIGSTSNNPSVSPAETHGFAGQEPTGGSPVNPSGGRSEVNRSEVKGVPPKSPSGGLASASPPSGMGDGDPEKNGGDIPTVEAVVAAVATSGVAEAYAREFHANLCEDHGWIKNNEVIDWQGKLRRRWVTWGADWLARQGKYPGGLKGWEKDMKELEGQLAAASDQDEKVPIWNAIDALEKRKPKF